MSDDDYPSLNDSMGAVAKLVAELTKARYRFGRFESVCRHMRSMPS